MKTMTCGCGQVVKGSSEKEVMDKMMNHMKSAHRGEEQKMMEEAKKTMKDE